MRLAFLFALVTSLLLPAAASARSQQEYAYAFENVWNAAIRLIRVDLSCAITDRDAEIGYLTFSYPEGGRAVPGSVELVRTTVAGRPGVRVVLSIPALPTYVERMIVDRLSRKLVEDFGDPPPPPRPAPPPAPPPESDDEDGENAPRNDDARDRRDDSRED